MRSSARDEGTVELLVVRPTVEERQVPAQVVVDVEQGLVGYTGVSAAAGAGPPERPIPRRR